MQHLAASTAAFASTQMLTELPGGKLDGIPLVSSVSITLSCLLVPLFWAVEGRVKRAAAEATATRGA